ncbi:MAG TPA: ribosomal protein S18-alanine N-acetyltransferase [bacterium]|nr:ribosomal protein S18-alanine N-acetyltransferase [bacterium]
MEAARIYVTVRRARQEDLPEILRIERESFNSPWVADMFASELSPETGLFLALEMEGVLAGYACGRAVRDEGHILKLAVAPELQRRGLGRELIDTLLLEFRRRGVEAAWLEVRRGNGPGRAFYRAFGFAEAGVRRRYYSDNDEDAVVMVKTI